MNRQMLSRVGAVVAVSIVLAGIVGGVTAQNMDIFGSRFNSQKS